MGDQAALSRWPAGLRNTCRARALGVDAVRGPCVSIAAQGDRVFRVLFINTHGVARRLEAEVFQQEEAPEGLLRLRPVGPPTLAGQSVAIPREGIYRGPTRATQALKVFPTPQPKESMQQRLQSNGIQNCLR